MVEESSGPPSRAKSSAQGENASMNVRGAVIEVLREAGVPLHVQEITKRVLGCGLWETKGKTPAATVGARLYSDIRKRQDTSPLSNLESNFWR